MCYTNFEEQKSRQVEGYKVVIKDNEGKFYSMSTLVEYQIGEIPKLMARANISRRIDLFEKNKLDFQTLVTIAIPDTEYLDNYLYTKDYKGSALFQDLEDCEYFFTTGWLNPHSDFNNLCIVKITGNLIGTAEYHGGEPLYLIDEIAEIKEWIE